MPSLRRGSRDRRIQRSHTPAHGGNKIIPCEQWPKPLLATRSGRKWKFPSRIHGCFIRKSSAQIYMQQAFTSRTRAAVSCLSGEAMLMHSKGYPPSLPSTPIATKLIHPTILTTFHPLKQPGNWVHTQHLRRHPFAGGQRTHYKYGWFVMVEDETYSLATSHSTILDARPSQVNYSRFRAPKWHSIAPPT